MPNTRVRTSVAATASATLFTIQVAGVPAIHVEEALLAWDPHALRELIAARKAEDWRKVGSIIDWLEAGLESTEWH